MWPEHADAYSTFAKVTTQWQIASMGGMGGGIAIPVGLNYANVLAALDRMHRSKSDEERDAIFADLQVIERAALDEMARKD